MRKRTYTWLILGVVLAMMGRTAFGLPQVVQEHYRWRNDDGNEAGASWKAAEDTAVTGQLTNENIRLRFTISNGTGLEAAPGLQLRLQYQTDRFGTFIDVPASGTSAPFVMSDATLYTNGTPTTSQLDGTGSFQPGVCLESPSNQMAAIDIEGEHYIEAEYCFKALSSTEGGTKYYFQLSHAGAELDQYEVYPEITFTIRPTLNNSAGETDLTASSATLQGTVTDTGGEAPTVYVCWGDNDAGTGTWDTVVNAGVQSGDFSTEISGLTANTVYFYRCYAENAAGRSWAPVHGTFTTPIPTVSHVSSSYSFSENDSYLDVNVRLSNKSGSAASVTIATSDGTATAAGNDYVATNRVLSWAAGQSGTKSIRIDMADDGGVDDDGEVFYVGLSGESGCTIAGDMTSTIHILDTDGDPTAQFALPTSSGSEIVTPVNIAVVLSHAFGSNVDVNYTWTINDAHNPDDYTAGSGTLTIGNGVTSSNIVVSVVNDGTWESNETFTLTLTNISAGTIGPASNHTYTIENDDVGLPVIDNGLGAAQVTESSATLRGQVIDEMGETPNVYIVWGTSTAGTTRAAWDHDIEMGALGVGTFSTNLTAGLTAGVTHYYRCLAVNAAGTAWANRPEPFTPAAPPSENLLVNYSGETAGSSTNLAQYWSFGSGGAYETWIHRTNAAPRSGSSSFGFADHNPGGPLGLFMYGSDENYFQVTWNGQYANSDGLHPSGGIRPGFVLSGTAHTRAREVGSDEMEFKYALYNNSEGNTWMIGSNRHNNVAYESVVMSNSYPMATRFVGDNVRPALTRVEFGGSGAPVYHGDDLSLHAVHPKLELQPTPSNIVAFPVTPDGMTSEITLEARSAAGSGNTILYGLYTENTAHMDGTTPWNYKAWDLTVNPDSVFNIVSGETLVATNNQGWYPMTVGFSPTGTPGTHTGIVRIATSDPNDWYGGGGKLLNSIVYEEFVIRATETAPLTITVNDIQVTENGTGTTDATFTISLSSACPVNVSVDYQTANDSAEAGSDYTTDSDTVVITAGQTSTNVTITVLGDNSPENDEVFHLNLTGTSEGTITDNQGACTIEDDDSIYPWGTVFRMK